MPKSKTKAKAQIATLSKSSTNSGRPTRETYVNGFRAAVNDAICQRLSKEEYRDALYEMRDDLDAYIAAVDAELEE